VSSHRKIVGTIDRMFVAGIVLAVAIGSLAVGIPRIASAVAVPAPATVSSGLGVGAQVAPAAAPITAEEKFGLAEGAAAAAAPAPVLLAAVKSAKAPVPRPVVKRAPVRGVAAGARGAARPSAVSGTGWRTARVSWYGPGFYGRRTANGTVLRPNSMVVAHRSLPFGTRIAFAYRGRTVIGVVADRGPFISGRVFDLGPGVAQALGFGGVQTVQYRILGR